MLMKAEDAVGLKEKLIGHLPELKSFLSTKKTCTEAALTAFTKLATNTGHQSSHFNQFEEILARNGDSKRFGLVKDRRFCNLGYIAAAVLHHKAALQEVLDTTKSNNLLVLACRVYLENKFLMNCIASLAYFTYKVNFPLFKLSLDGNQEDCKDLLPKLFVDLQNCNLDTLDKYKVYIEKFIFCLMNLL